MLRRCVRFPSTQAAGRWLSTRGGGSRLSRTERRQMELKRKAQERKKRLGALRNESLGESAVETDPTNGSSTSSVVSRVGAFLSWALPLTGSHARFDRDRVFALAYRLPAWAFLCYILTNDDIMPLSVQAGMGPSMLPTIQFFGDIWLVGTESLQRFLGLKRNYCVGDIVTWSDPKTGASACKRVVGVGGDSVLRYGEFVHMYKNRNDRGIVWPRDAEKRNLDPECSWDSNKDNSAIDRKIVVPDGYLWLEGDCPLFSIDSRHYGPIPIDYVRGKLLVRLWPFQKEGEKGAYPRLVDRKRPRPYPAEDAYLGKRFRLYKLDQASQESQ